MPAITQAPQSRPHGAPAYYLGRPASVWLMARHTRPQRPAGSGTTLPSERNPR